MRNIVLQLYTYHTATVFYFSAPLVSSYHSPHVSGYRNSKQDTARELCGAHGPSLGLADHGCFPETHSALLGYAGQLHNTTQRYKHVHNTHK